MVLLREPEDELLFLIVLELLEVVGLLNVGLLVLADLLYDE